MQPTYPQDQAVKEEGHTVPRAPETGRAPRDDPADARGDARGAETRKSRRPRSRLVVSEAALYRHFPSKAKMYEGLIEFIEQALFGS